MLLVYRCRSTRLHGLVCQFRYLTARFVLLTVIAKGKHRIKTAQIHNFGNNFRRCPAIHAIAGSLAAAAPGADRQLRVSLRLRPAHAAAVLDDVELRLHGSRVLPLALPVHLLVMRDCFAMKKNLHVQLIVSQESLFFLPFYLHVLWSSNQRCCCLCFRYVMFVSIHNLVYISVERFLALVRPLYYKGQSLTLSSLVADKVCPKPKSKVPLRKDQTRNNAREPTRQRHVQHLGKNSSMELAVI